MLEKKRKESAYTMKKMLEAYFWASVDGFLVLSSFLPHSLLH